MPSNCGPHRVPSLLLTIGVLVLLLLLATGPGRWAPPRVGAQRATVPTRTPTAPPPTAPPPTATPEPTPPASTPGQPWPTPSPPVTPSALGGAAPSHAVGAANPAPAGKEVSIMVPQVLPEVGALVGAGLHGIPRSGGIPILP